MNPPEHFPVVHRPVQMSGMVIQAARKQSTKSRAVEGEFDVEIDSAATSCWCYLNFGSCTHMVDLLNPITYS